MRRRIATVLFLFTAILTTIGLLAFYHYGRSIWFPVYGKYRGVRTVTNVIQLYGKTATARLLLAISRVGVAYPPDRIALLGLKAERSLEVWAFD